MFITLEGPEGSGKTSQIPPLAAFLHQEGFDVIVTREPGGTDVGDQIRGVLMNLQNVTMVPRTEILLFLAARAQHVDVLIRPALEDGKIVLCDRFSDSTLAYQGYGHQTELATLKTLLDFATDGQYPDLTLLLDISVEKGLARKRANDEEWNRLDAYEIAFHKRVRQGYLTMAAEDPGRWVCIDAAQSKAKVQQAMQEAILARLQRKA